MPDRLPAECASYVIPESSRGGKTYVLYSIAGESGLAIGELREP